MSEPPRCTGAAFSLLVLLPPGYVFVGFYFLDFLDSGIYHFGGLGPAVRRVLWLYGCCFRGVGGVRGVACGMRGVGGAGGG